MWGLIKQEYPFSWTLRISGNYEGILGFPSGRFYMLLRIPGPPWPFGLYLGDFGHYFTYFGGLGLLP